MQITAPQCANSPSAIQASELPVHIKSHLNDARIRQLSPHTFQERGIYLSKLVWFLKLRDYPMFDTDQARDFFAYLTEGHKDPSGRWGDPRQRQPLRPITIRSYYTQYKVVFNWLVEEGVLETSPMAGCARPRPAATKSLPLRPNT